MNMNRRNFLRSGIASVVVLPFIGLAKEKEIPFEVDGDYIEILNPVQLNHWGFRSAHYCANCVDKNGIFAHETGFDHDHSEPFIVKYRRLECMRRVDVGREDLIQEWKSQIFNSEFGQGYLRAKIKKEIREKMEYVTGVWYIKSPCISCCNPNCKQWVPLIRGLYKERYNRYMKDFNV